jgi:hypothetical protein
VKQALKYTGDEVVIRIGTSATNCLTAPPLTNLESLTYKVNQNTTQVAVGIGSRGTEVYGTLVKYTGTIVRWVDELAEVSGATGSFATNVGAFTIGALTPLFLAVKNKLTGTVIVLCGCIGDYQEDLKTTDGFLEETWTFMFASITNTTGSPGP